jgi:hypothetical protein
MELELELFSPSSPLVFSSPSPFFSHWVGVFWHAYESWDMLERGL